MQSASRGGTAVLEVNRRFYDALWRDVRLVEPQHFNTWPLVCSLTAGLQSRLEVAPGLRPRLPLEGTYFVDLSRPAVEKLRARGANAIVASVSALPFPDRAFRLICAFDIVEHVEDEDSILSELSRVAASRASLLLSVPLHPAHWTAFDNLVGHHRRYEPQRLLDKLTQHGFAVEQSAVYGMQPRSSRLLDVGMWFLANRREQAVWWYTRVFVPLGLRFQKKLVLAPGFSANEQIDEVFLVCRKLA
jgi:SAM-dependent methyltransferase